jgi:hypothetical protein
MANTVAQLVEQSSCDPKVKGSNPGTAGSGSKEQYKIYL